jgi:hypothetical protein
MRPLLGGGEFIGKYSSPPGGKEKSADVIGGKYVKEDEKKEENVKNKKEKSPKIQGKLKLKR